MKPVNPSALSSYATGVKSVMSMTPEESERYNNIVGEQRSQGATVADAIAEAESTIGRERKEREANHKENDHE